MLWRRGGGKKTDERVGITGEKTCNEDVGYRSGRVMDIHQDEIVMTSQGKLKVIV